MSAAAASSATPSRPASAIARPWGRLVSAPPPSSAAVRALSDSSLHSAAGHRVQGGPGDSVGSKLAPRTASYERRSGRQNTRPHRRRLPGRAAYPINTLSAGAEEADPKPVCTRPMRIGCRWGAEPTAYRMSCHSRSRSWDSPMRHTPSRRIRDSTAACPDAW